MSRFVCRPTSPGFALNSHSDMGEQTPVGRTFEFDASEVLS